MLRIAVFDVPAVDGGALSVLNEYYERAIEDTKNEWLFVVSGDSIKSKRNIKVIRFPWVKKSWVHRIYFELFVAHKVVHDNKVDKIISLHNLLVPFAKVPNEVYFHQALIFSEKRFSITENPKFWIYQNIISIPFRYSIKHADKVIIQTRVLAKIINKKLGVSMKNITIRQPAVSPELKNVRFNGHRADGDILQFIYPAAPYEYKGHKDIIRALKLLDTDQLEKIQIIFTFDGSESSYAKMLKQEAVNNNLPVKFIGYVKHYDLVQYYKSSALLFTSSIESFGVPLVEARLANAPIIASATDITREVLDSYQNACYYQPGCPSALASIIKSYIKNGKIMKPQFIQKCDKLLFIGGMYAEGEENEYLKNTKSGGIQSAVNTHQWGMIKGLRSTNSVDVQCLSAPYLSSYPNYSKIIVKPVVDKDFYSVGYLNLPILKELIRTFMLCVYVKKWVKRTRKDKNCVIISYYVSIPQMIASTFFTKKITKILVVPDLPNFLNLSINISPASRLMSQIKASIIKLLISRFDGYILVTKHMIDMLGLEPKRCLVSDGFVADEDIMSESEIGNRQYVNSVVYAGGLHEKYGVRSLIDSMGYVEDKSLRLYIFGAGEMEREIIDRAKLDSRIKYMGYRSRKTVLDYQRKAKILINPRDSSHDYVKYSFPSKNLEYLACGAIVICCKLPCMEKEYDDVFYYSKSGSAKDLANAITRNLKISKLDAQMVGLKSMKFIREEKSSTIQGRHIVDFVDLICTKRK